MQIFQILVRQISLKMHAKVANLNCFQHSAVFRKTESGGNEPGPLILRSTAHGHLPQPDGAEYREREGAAGAAPAGGERLGGGLGATAGSLGSGRAAVASPESLLRGGTAWWPCGLKWSSGCSSAAPGWKGE